MNIVVSILRALIAVLNAMVNKLTVSIIDVEYEAIDLELETATATDEYSKPFTFRVAAILATGGDENGRYTKATDALGMRVAGFKRYYTHSAFSSYEQAASHAKNYSQTGELYAVTDDEIIVGVYCNGVIVAGFAYRNR